MPPVAERQGARKPWLAVVKIIVSVGLLYLLSRNIDFAGLKATLLRMPLSAVAAAVALIALQTLLMGVRWWLVLSALWGPMPLARIVRLNFVGVFFNQVLPTSVGGDALRIWHVHRGGVRLRTAVKSVLLERIWGVLVLSLLVAAGLLWLGGRIDNAPLRLGLIAILPLGLLGVGVLTSFDLMPVGLRRWRLLAALARLGGDARRLFLSPAVASPLFALSVAGHVLSALVVYALAAGLGLGLSPWVCLAVVPSVLLTMLIPLSFAGWGLREGAMVVMLGYLGTAADAALAISLVFGVAMILAALPGCLFWLQWREAPAAAPSPEAGDG